MRIIAALLFATAATACTSAQTKSNTKTTEVTMETTTEATSTNVYSYTMPSIDGGTINLADYKGKKILIVNTASECGYTRQYEGLETLYAGHKDKLVVLGVPANNFGGQEPGTNEQIASFCKKNYGVTFPLTAKQEVVGENQHPMFKWLTTKDQNNVLDAKIKWNFNKFLLDENGKLLAYFPSSVEPNSDEILNYLK